MTTGFQKTKDTAGVCALLLAGPENYSQPVPAEAMHSKNRPEPLANKDT